MTAKKAAVPNKSAGTMSGEPPMSAAHEVADITPILDAQHATDPTGFENLSGLRRRLLVVSKREGFRRAGRAWSMTPTQVSVDEFIPEQLAQLHAEPMLHILKTLSDD